MTKEQEEAIKTMKHWIDFEKQNKDKINKADELIKIQETVLNMLKEKDAEIEKKDNAVRKIIKRLNNDIERTTKIKSDGKHCDDYSRCRLKAYKTKTKEIKEYIEEQYFERKSEE